MIHFRLSHFLALAVASCAILTRAHAQTSAIPTNIRASYTMQELSDANAVSRNDVFYGVPAPPGKVVGDTYLSTSWRKSAIQLYKDERVIEGYPVRYDIQANALDVKTDAGIKVLDGKRIQSFSWLDSTKLEPVFFVNASDYKLDGAPLLGFFEVLVDGKAPLFKRTDLHLKKANYNVSFDVGTRDDKILKQPTYFTSKGKDAIEVTSSKKKMAPLFGERTGEMEKYMDENNLSLKREQDLIKAFQHYNRLLTP